MRGGDDAALAFEALWDAYYRRLMVFAAAYRGLPSAERHDAAADALIAAFGGLRGFDPRRPLSPWVYRIAANHFSDAARRARRESTIEVGQADSAGSDDGATGGYRGPAVVEPATSGDHEADSVERDLVERCEAAIAALPEADRRVAMLRFYEGFSAADVGRALGMPAGTVRWRVGVIRAAIRAATGEDRP
ncbi:MAG TPA: sigma-70 family RNA polymerase sigma factor [Spirochaetales bacterium]|nr:sigma-70 family RNA polymerase sigma factor [Spirochaetales bacterium]HPB66715.1 sigma-70 family RNA polymerase sigma factor [Spirochaetales bacterium]HPM73581.1 sigma-70 family RNA polymerase sigma factor [Spirochaetales bacterium]